MLAADLAHPVLQTSAVYNPVVQLDERRRARSRAPAAAPDAAPTPARIGPNSVLQSLRALEELEPRAVYTRVLARAAFPQPPDQWPHGLIPEAWFTQLLRALRDTVPPARSEEILRRAGAYTAAYVARHRIPAPIRAALGALPAALALPLFLRAVRRHAWTFAGSGAFRFSSKPTVTLILESCPTCRPDAHPPVPGGAYYEAAFAGLLRLAAGPLLVRETSCISSGAPHCCFQLERTTTPPREPACASS